MGDSVRVEWRHDTAFGWVAELSWREWHGGTAHDGFVSKTNSFAAASALLNEYLDRKRAESKAK